LSTETQLQPEAQPALAQTDGAAVLHYERAPGPPLINPWLFVPALYFMQAVPNILVVSTFAPIYRTLGIDVIRIAMWTGLASLPWVFKMFWGPLVDLNSTKRNWTLLMQVLISLTLLVTAGLLGSRYFFALTVAAMFLLATFSATHDIACDGLYLMSLDKKRQAAFSGVMAACARLGRLFVDSVLLVIAGWLINRGLRQQMAWVVALGVCGVIYAAGTIWNFFWLPRPAADVPVADVAPAERTRNIWRTLTVVATGVVAYYLINGLLQLIGYAIFRSVTAGSVPKTWNLTHAEQITQWVKIGACAALLPMLWMIIRAQVRGTTMGDAFVSYIRQSGFGWILAFIVFYRFGEAMIFAMASLFILDKPSLGGMGVSIGQLGMIKGVGQVLGLMLGGLLGGWWISRIGLRRAFWPLVICMHVPNILYIWAAFTLPRTLWLYPVVFAEAFGYGAGFAGYFVYLMDVAQRGKYVTSHYAIGTGLGALFITFATILAGIVQSVFGYRGVFVAACLLTIPGTLTLLFIPLDESQGRSAKPAPAAAH
jgi:PAT family beta-lactamase induction signal transducer AmpG